MKPYRSSCGHQRLTEVHFSLYKTPPTGQLPHNPLVCQRIEQPERRGLHSLSGTGAADCRARRPGFIRAQRKLLVGCNVTKVVVSKAHDELRHKRRVRLDGQADLHEYLTRQRGKPCGTHTQRLNLRCKSLRQRVQYLDFASIGRCPTRIDGLAGYR